MVSSTSNTRSSPTLQGMPSEVYLMIHGYVASSPESRLILALTCRQFYYLEEDCRRSVETVPKYSDDCSRKDLYRPRELIRGGRHDLCPYFNFCRLMERDAWNNIGRKACVHCLSSHLINEFAAVDRNKDAVNRECKDNGRHIKIHPALYLDTDTYLTLLSQTDINVSGRIDLPSRFKGSFLLTKQSPIGSGDGSAVQKVVNGMPRTKQYQASRFLANVSGVALRKLGHVAQLWLEYTWTIRLDMFQHDLKGIKELDYRNELDANWLNVDICPHGRAHDLWPAINEALCPSRCLRYPRGSNIPATSDGSWRCTDCFGTIVQVYFSSSVGRISVDGGDMYVDGPDTGRNVHFKVHRILHLGKRHRALTMASSLCNRQLSKRRNSGDTMLMQKAKSVYRGITGEEPGSAIFPDG